MRRLGQGRTEKVAAWGALQCRRGDAPKAAFKLSPTFAADNGQRANPHAASARIDAAAQPHATARRMLRTSPSAPLRTTGCAVNESWPAKRNSSRKCLGISMTATSVAGEGRSVGERRTIERHGWRYLR